MTKALRISRDDLATVYDPYILRRFERDDPEWCAIVRRHQRRWRKARLTRILRLEPRPPAKPQVKVRKQYEGAWNNFEFEKLTPLGRCKPHALQWHGECHLGNAAGIHRVHLFVLKQLIEELQPASVLEVGAGCGINLMTLAAHFPNVRFTGIELTKSGVATARSISRTRVLPPPLAEFAPFDTPHGAALSNIEFHNGSARALPFKDHAFDLVFTRQALEQMESIRDTALREVARVSANHVLMYEAFRDWNARGLCRNRTVATGYFAARLSDLQDYDLDLVGSVADLPSKIYMTVGLAIAKRAGAESDKRVPIR